MAGTLSSFLPWVGFPPIRRAAQACCVSVGQRQEPFHIAVGKAFDVCNQNPGAEVGGNNDDLEGQNVSALALEVPISCQTAGTEPVIGAYTTASLRMGSLLNGAPAIGLGELTRTGRLWTQVSRLGMPLASRAPTWSTCF